MSSNNSGAGRNDDQHYSMHMLTRTKQRLLASLTGRAPDRQPPPYHATSPYGQQQANGLSLLSAHGSPQTRGGGGGRRAISPNHQQQQSYYAQPLNRRTSSSQQHL
jgi:hypothetical protein